MIDGGYEYCLSFSSDLYCGDTDENVILVIQCQYTFTVYCYNHIYVYKLIATMITARSRWRGFLCIDALSEYQATAYESRSLTVWTAVPSHVSSSPWLLSHHCIMQASSSRRMRCSGSCKTPRTLHISSTTIMSIYTIRMTGTSRIIATLYHNHSYYNKAPSNAGTCWTTRRTTSCWCTTWGPMMHGMAMEVTRSPVVNPQLVPQRMGTE